MKPHSRSAKSAHRPSAAASDAVGFFRAQHLDVVRRVIVTDDGPAEVLADDSESPLRR